MDEETELSSKIYECNDHGERIVTDFDGYWNEVDAEIRRFTPDDPRLPENRNHKKGFDFHGSASKEI